MYFFCLLESESLGRGVKTVGVMMVPGEPQQSLLDHCPHEDAAGVGKGQFWGVAAIPLSLPPLQGPTLKIWAKPSGRVPRLGAVPYFWSPNGGVVPEELIRHHLRGLHSQGWLLGRLQTSSPGRAPAGGDVPCPPEPPVPVPPGRLSPAAWPCPASLLCSCLFLSAGRITSSKISLSWLMASW